VLVPSAGAAASAAVNRSENNGVSRGVGRGMFMSAVLAMIGWAAMLL